MYTVDPPFRKRSGIIECPVWIVGQTGSCPVVFSANSPAYNTTITKYGKVSLGWLRFYSNTYKLIPCFI